MQIHVHTDTPADAGDERRKQVGDMLNQVLGRFGAQLSRIDAHLSGEPDGPRCRLEASVDGRAAIGVSHRADFTAQAVRGAADKLARLLEGSLGRPPSTPPASIRSSS